MNENLKRIPQKVKLGDFLKLVNDKIENISE
jgi:hypothetical protein